MDRELSMFWATAQQHGFGEAAHLAAEVYPMPGSSLFDDDESFLSLTVFPADKDHEETLVRQEKWAFPPTWLRGNETRPASQRTLSFELKPSISANRELVSAAEVFVRRCAYLELFRSRRASSISTTRQRLNVYRRLAEFAVAEGKRVTELNYSDLLAFVAGLSKHNRRRLPNSHDMMRWWRASAPGSFSGYMPPPSLDGRNAGAGGGRVGFNPEHVRPDGEDLHEDRRWQPLPDDFVAALGEFCLWVTKELRPVYHEFLRLLRSYGADEHARMIPRLATAFRWPEGYGIKNRQDCQRIGNTCQFSAIFLLSLLLGPRWSEMSALPRTCLRRLSSGEYLLDGSTFKSSQNLSGDVRDWPVHPDLAVALLQQQEYIELTEDGDFKYLWRQHFTVLRSGAPLRQIQAVLTDIIERTEFEPLLKGTSFHHHRFRKTTARMIVLALHGGPLVLRRLFGHQHLGVTLRYILANQSIVDELRAIAEEEQRQLAATFIDRREELAGGGAEGFREAIDRVVSEAEIYVPEGKRAQANVTTEDVLDVLSADQAEGLYLKQIVPGLIVCFKPNDEAGMCCKAGELPNVARCSMQCGWHLEMPEYKDEARKHVEAALTHLRATREDTLQWHYYSNIVQAKLTDFPDLREEFAANPYAAKLLGI